MLSLVAVTRDPKTDLRTIRGNADSKGSVPGVIYGKNAQALHSQLILLTSFVFSVKLVILILLIFQLTVKNTKQLSTT